LCPQERRVFQSKLGVSSSNQCNLHHSPHTRHLGKKNKRKGTIFFGHSVYKWKPMLRRSLGRPKNGWEDAIRNDMN